VRKRARQRGRASRDEETDPARSSSQVYARSRAAAARCSCRRSAASPRSAWSPICRSTRSAGRRRALSPNLSLKDPVFGLGLRRPTQEQCAGRNRRRELKVTMRASRSSGAPMNSPTVASRHPLMRAFVYRRRHERGLAAPASSCSRRSGLMLRARLAGRRDRPRAYYAFCRHAPARRCVTTTRAAAPAHPASRPCPSREPACWALLRQNWPIRRTGGSPPRRIADFRARCRYERVSVRPSNEASMATRSPVYSEGSDIGSMRPGEESDAGLRGPADPSGFVDAQLSSRLRRQASPLRVPLPVPLDEVRHT